MAVARAANEEYRKKNATINQVDKAAKPRIQLIQNKTPAAVATPFPP